MSYDEVNDARNEMRVFSLDMCVDDDSVARVIDSVLKDVDIKEIGIIELSDEDQERIGCDAKRLLAICVYGLIEDIVDLQILEKECKVNMELMWLSYGAKPKAEEIKKFYIENLDAIKRIIWMISSAMQQLT